MDIATLGVNVDSSGVVRATGDLDRMGDQAAVTQKQVGALGRSSAQSFTTAARGAKGFQAALQGPGIRNASLQLSQVAQQTAATGNFVQALAIQLPDLALGFGTIGIAAGVAAGALLPVVANLIGARDEAQVFKDRMDDLEATMDTLGQSLDILSLNVRELRDRYGEAAETVRIFAERQAQLRLAQLNSQLQEQTSLLVGVAGAYFQTIDAGRSYRNALSAIQRDFGLTADAARDFEAALTEASTAGTLDEQAAALDRVFALLEDAGVAASDIPPELAMALDEMISLIRETRAAEQAAANVAAAAGGIEGALAGATGEAARLAANLGIAIDQAISLQNLRNSLQYSGRGGDPRRFGDPTARDPSETTGRLSEGAEALIAAANRASRRRTSGGSRRGGVSEADREMQRMLQERDSILDNLKTAQDRYNDSVAQADRLLAAGVLTQADYNRQLDHLKMELDEIEFEAVYEGIDEISRSFADAIIDGEGFGDAIRNIMRRVASDILTSGISSALESVFNVPQRQSAGGLFSGLLGGLFGGFRANGGPVQAGRSYVVGERGKELFTPDRNGYITPNDAMGGEVRVYVMAEEGAMFRPTVRAEAQGVAVQVVASNNARVAERQRR